MPIVGVATFVDAATGSSVGSGSPRSRHSVRRHPRRSARRRAAAYSSSVCRPSRSTMANGFRQLDVLPINTLRGRRWPSLPGSMKPNEPGKVGGQRRARADVRSTSTWTQCPDRSGDPAGHGPTSTSWSRARRLAPDLVGLAPRLCAAALAQSSLADHVGERHRAGHRGGVGGVLRLAARRPEHAVGR